MLVWWDSDGIPGFWDCMIMFTPQNHWLILGSNKCILSEEGKKLMKTEKKFSAFPSRAHWEISRKEMGRWGIFSSLLCHPGVTQNHAILPLRILQWFSHNLQHKTQTWAQHQRTFWLPPFQLVLLLSTLHVSPGSTAVPHGVVLDAILLYFDLHVFVHLFPLLENTTLSLSPVRFCPGNSASAFSTSLTLPGNIFPTPVSPSHSAQEQVRCPIYSFSCKLSWLSSQCSLC